MMGLNQAQTELWVGPVNLARRVPDDHFLRRLNKALDLGFVREEVARFYGKKGNVSVDPVIIMKMMLLLFLDNVRSERELMRIIPLRIDYLWYLGYGLEDEIPNHSVLSKARRRWGTEVFESLFKKTIALCLGAGLVDGSKLHVDASLIRADASKNSVVDVALHEVLGKLDEVAAPAKSKTVNQSKKSTTDPDSTVVRHRSGPSVPSYKNHRVVDDKVGVVTVTKTTTGAVNEAHELVDLTREHHANTGIVPKVVVADSMYGTIENFTTLGYDGITTHMGDFRSKQSNHRAEGIYDQKAFKYERKNDRYICPAGKTLTPKGVDYLRGYTEYAAAKGVCGSCVLRSHCTRSKEGRTINRYALQEVIDRARRQSSSEQGREDRKRRQHLQERNFADAANLHGFKRARWRGLWRQSLQDSLIAALQNLRLLVRAGLGPLLVGLHLLNILLSEVSLLINQIFHPVLSLRLTR
jgi:transposase